MLKWEGIVIINYLFHEINFMKFSWNWFHEKNIGQCVGFVNCCPIPLLSTIISHRKCCRQARLDLVYVLMHIGLFSSPIDVKIFFWLFFFRIPNKKILPIIQEITISVSWQARQHYLQKFMPIIKKKMRILSLKWPLAE